MTDDAPGRGQQPDDPTGPPQQEGAFEPPPPPAGDFPAPPPAGEEWVGGPPPGPPPPGTELAGPEVAHKSHDERRAMLADNLQQAATRGLRVESQTDYQAVLVEGKPVNHTLHAILTVVTCLFYGPVYLVIALTGGEKKHQLVVDEFGNVHWQALGKV